MAYACFWVQGDCIRPELYTCKGCQQFPYGDNEVSPPSVPADVGQQLLGMHIGMAELLAKKGIAKPEELDEAIARNIERLINQDMMLRNAACEVDHVLDAMPRLVDPGKLDMYVALDDEGTKDTDAISAKVVEALRSFVPAEIEIGVVVAEAKPPEAGSEKTTKARKKPSAKPAGKSSSKKE